MFALNSLRRELPGKDSRIGAPEEDPQERSVKIDSSLNPAL